MKKATVYRFEPVGWDVFRPTANQPPSGSLVRKVQPRGCPPNGTMGHCFIQPIDGADFCLVQLGSLVKV
jgi:hypothetical protein